MSFGSSTSCRRVMETIFASLADCGHKWVSKGQWCGAWYSCDIGMNKQLNKKSRCRWFETPWRPCTVPVMICWYYQGNPKKWGTMALRSKFHTYTYILKLSYNQITCIWFLVLFIGGSYDKIILTYNFGSGAGVEKFKWMIVWICII